MGTKEVEKPTEETEAVKILIEQDSPMPQTQK